MKHLWIVVVILISFLLISCTALQTPEEIVQRQVAAQYSASGSVSFKLRGSRAFDDKTTVVLFSVADVAVNDEPAGGSEDFLGFAVLQKGFIGWKRGMDGGKGGDLAVLSQDMVDIAYAAPSGAINDVEYGVVYGQIFSSTVASVQLLLRDGTTLTDDGRDDVFAFYLPVPMQPETLQVLDGAGNVLLTKLVEP